MTTIAYKKHRTPEQDARTRKQRQRAVRAYDAAIERRGSGRRGRAR